MILRTQLLLKPSIKFRSWMGYALAIFVMACVSVPTIYVLARPDHPQPVSGLRRLTLIVEADAAALRRILDPDLAAWSSSVETVRPAPTTKRSGHSAAMINPAALALNPAFAPEVPTRLLIPVIDLDAPVVTVGFSTVTEGGKTVTRWDVPDWAAAGWLNTSAHIGEVGNTVLVGHQNIYGRIFRNLEYLKPGDKIQLLAGEQTREYVVSQMEILPEKDQPIEVQRANAQWIARTDDERLTLVTCWPRNSNTHRLIVVALPIDATAETTPVVP